MSDSSDEAEFTGNSPGESEEEDEDEEDYEDKEEVDDEPPAESNAKDHGSDEESDVPLSSLKRPARSPTKKAISYAENDDDDDNDSDDIPLAALGKKKPPAKAAAASPKKTKKTNGKKAAKDEESPPAKKKQKTKTSTKAAAASTAKKSASAKAASTPSESNNNASSNKTYEWVSAALYGTECTKGLLIQRLLCRWWYAYTWPDPSKIPEEPPNYYDALDGFPGVYVCTSQPATTTTASVTPTKTSSKKNGTKPPPKQAPPQQPEQQIVAVGHILDLRDPSAAPSFANFLKKSSKELKDLLLKALQEQKKQLVEIEKASHVAGTATKTSATEKELDQLISWTKRVDADKADREVVKILKAQGLQLPPPQQKEKQQGGKASLPSKYMDVETPPNS